MHPVTITAIIMGSAVGVFIGGAVVFLLVMLPLTAL